MEEVAATATYQHDLKEMAPSVDARDTPIQWIRADFG